MWTGGIIYFDQEKRKQELIGFTHRDLAVVLASILKQAMVHLSYDARNMLCLLQSQNDLPQCEFDEYADRQWRSLTRAEGRQLEELMHKEFAKSEDPIALLTRWCERDKWFREYGHTAEEALRGWSFFVKHIKC